MAVVTEIPDTVPEVRAPRSPLSPGEIAAPYQQLANTLDKAGETLSKDVAIPLAHQAGLRSVTRDPDGNIKVDNPPIFGDAAPAFVRAQKFAGIADAEGALKRDDIAMREQFRDNPKGYLTAAEKYKQEKVKQYTDILGPEVGITLGKIIDSTTTQTWRGLQNEHERLELERATNSVKFGRQSAVDDILALSRGGVNSGKAWDDAMAKYNTLTNELVANPRMAYPPEQAKFDRDHLDGQVGAGLFLHSVEDMYRDPKIDVDQRAQQSLEYARGILTEPNLKLSQAEREHYYHQAVSAIHAAEGIRRQDIMEVRYGERELNSASMLGLPVTPDMVNKIGDAYHRLGSFADEARLYASFARKPLNDAFGQQPLTDQAGQLFGLRERASASGAYQFFINKGYTPAAAAGIVGNLIHESGLDPNKTHDQGIGLGIAGWNKERLDALTSFAASRGTSPRDLQTQLEFIDKELHSTEGATFARLQAARSPDEAAAAFINYERPQGWSPGSETTASGFTNRVGLARAVAANASGTPSVGPMTPSQALWLSANRSHEIQNETRKTWTATIKDWNEKGVRPNDDVVTQLITAARATGDHDLLETMGHDLDRVALVQNQGRLPLAEQQAGITQARSEAEGGGLTIGQGAVLKQLEQRYQAITTGLEHDPIATTVANFPERFRAPGPLDLGNDGNFMAGLRVRSQIAGFAMQNWGGGPRAALDSADLAAVKGALDQADPAGKARIFANIAAGIPDERVRNATLHKIGEAGGMVDVFAGSLLPTAPDVSRGIFNGQQAMKVDKRYDPMEGSPGAKDKFNGEIDKRLPVTAFGLQGRSDPLGPYETMRNAVRAQYANLSAIAGDTKGDLDNTRLQKAVDDVTGGVLSHNGGSFIAPRRGMSQGQFDAIMGGISDADLTGVTTLAGEPITAGYLRAQARLETIGDGRYLVTFGRDSARPIYAYTGANTELPGKFVLDLTRRTVPPVPFQAPPSQPGG